MKKRSILVLALCMAALMAACGNDAQTAPTSASNSPGSPSSISQPASTVPDEEAQWQAFLKEMEGKGVSPDDIYNLETSSIPRQEIMKMSPEDVANKMTEIRAVIVQNKKDLAKDLLTNPESAKDDSQFVFSDPWGTTSLDLVESCIDSIKANDWGSFTGFLVGHPLQMVYEVAHEPDSPVTLTVYGYNGPDTIKVTEYVVTDIYETELFYQFANRTGLHFSIPKQSLHYEAPVAVAGYQKDSDLPGAKISAKQACKIAEEVNSLINGYITPTGENRDAMNGFGMLIPADFSTKEPIDPTIAIVAEGAAQINGKPHYLVSFYRGEDFAGESYYVSAENPDNIYLLSMVGGELIPVSYQNAEHFVVPE